MAPDDINHPTHYNTLGVECIDVVENFNFNIGNAIKYMWRAGLKGDRLTDLKKAEWYIRREIARIESRHHISDGTTTPVLGKE
jgi:hypothetical protein